QTEYFRAIATRKYLVWKVRKNRRGDRVWPHSLICLRVAGWCFVRNTAVRIALAGQYGDRRNISAQLRRGNISSVPALQICAPGRLAAGFDSFTVSSPRIAARGDSETLPPGTVARDLISSRPHSSHLPIPALQRVLSRNAARAQCPRRTPFTQNLPVR